MDPINGDLQQRYGDMAARVSEWLCAANIMVAPTARYFRVCFRQNVWFRVGESPVFRLFLANTPQGKSQGAPGPGHRGRLGASVSIRPVVQFACLASLDLTRSQAA